MNPFSQRRDVGSKDFLILFMDGKILAEKILCMALSALGDHRFAGHKPIGAGVTAGDV
jgi:hypothetical protein